MGMELKGRTITVFLILAFCIKMASPMDLVCKGDEHSACPSACTCRADHEGHTSVFCSRKGLTQIPSSFPLKTTFIDIRENHISKVPEYSFHGCVYLKKLLMSSNGLDHIDQRALCNASELAVLDLSSNRLSFDTVSVPLATFADLTTLDSLDISNNWWPGMPAYRDDLMLALSKLTVLLMDGIPGNATLGPGFSHLTGLQELHISGGLTTLPNDFFAALSGAPVIQLTIQNTSLCNIANRAFSPLSNLTYLILKHNPLLGMTNLSQSFHGLQNTSVRSIQIIQCTDFFAGPHHLGETFFEKLSPSNVTEMVLSNNNLGNICPCFSRYLPTLETLKINNDYQFGLSSLSRDIPFLQRLKYLEITPAVTFGHYKPSSARQVSKNHYVRTRGFKEPVYHSKSESLIQFLPWSGDPTTRDDNLHKPRAFPPPLEPRRHIYSSPYKSKGFTGNTLLVQLPPSLKDLTIQVTNTPLVFSDVFPSIHMLGENKLQRLDLSRVIEFTGELVIDKPDPAARFLLSLANNGLTDLNPDFLKRSIDNGLKLTYLYLMSNKLGRYFSYINNTFDFPHLEALGLDDNLITTFPMTFFKNLKKLKSLSLYMNNIQTIPLGLDHLSELEYLDLSHNKIPYLDDQTMETLDELSLYKPLEVIIDGNPLICSCDSLNFLKWLFETNVTIQCKRYLTCAYGQEIVYIEQERRELVDKLTKRCYSRDYVRASAISFGIFAVLLALLVFCYRHRWDIQFFLLRLVRQRKLYQEAADDERLYRYDGFVLYDDEDKAWVEDQLLPHLEGTDHNGEPQFRLCVHYRDFMASIPIYHSIIDSIQQSKKIIVVLSKHFVASRWCAFELEMANIRCVEEGRDLIVVIMLESVPATAMSSTLAALIKKVTYLKWPNHSAHREEFWARLRETMGRRNTRNRLCACGRQMYPLDSDANDA